MLKFETKKKFFTLINVTLLQPALKGAVEKLTPHIRLQFGKLTNFRHHTLKSLDHVRTRFAFQVSGKGLFRKHVHDHQNILVIVVVGFEQRKINEVGLHLKASTGHDRFSLFEFFSHRFVKRVSVLRLQPLLRKASSSRERATFVWVVIIQTLSHNIDSNSRTPGKVGSLFFNAD